MPTIKKKSVRVPPIKRSKQPAIAHVQNNLNAYSDIRQKATVKQKIKKK